ncbi:hypothetical protein AB0J28_00500 [Streptosporangium canum]|uniref:hypothetical protein n=1 Tax=Streptosporangium canum TaxID=324952 RepID=UPI0034316317
MTDAFPHGEMRGYRRHLRENTIACDPCLDAARRDYAARTRARAAAGKPPKGVIAKARAAKKAQPDA